MTKQTTAKSAASTAISNSDDDFFIAPSRDSSENYTAHDIEVLEGLEPVRRRPGMYIGGTDARAMHHLFAEIIDNAMDEAIAGHASFIEVDLMPDNWVRVRDNGRGIPIDMHPKFKDKSALEIIMTTLHAGGKFDSTAYDTVGGLHGVGVSVVNALSDSLIVEVARNKVLYRQSFARGHPEGGLIKIDRVHNRRGTDVRFRPDPEIFGPRTRFDPLRVFAMAKAKAYLFGGVEIRWQCTLDDVPSDVPQSTVLHFPNGLADRLAEELQGATLVTALPFVHKSDKVQNGHGSIEWAMSWIGDHDGQIASYCNTIPTPDGGTHEAGLRAALTKGIKAYGALTNNKRIAQVTTEDVMSGAVAFISVFIREPEFQGQTKDRLATPEAGRIVEQAVRSQFDHWLTASPHIADRFMRWVIDRADERNRRRQEKEVSRKTATRKLRLPGKLADCARSSAEGAELFIVEGDSAGGSAKQARNRNNQAILPLRGKILNVANATNNKIQQSQQLADLVQALGCGTTETYESSRLRYEKIIIMTDADVDGAHIASLLMTFFHEKMPDLIFDGHLYLAVPPLYRITQGTKTLYARDDEHMAELMKNAFNPKHKIDIGRFKGLGEMMPAQLKETTMNPSTRTLLQITIDDAVRDDTAQRINELMGNKPELRFRFIQENAGFAENIDI